MKLSDRAGNLPQQTFPLLPDIHTKVFTEGIHQKCQTKDVHTKRSAFGTPIPHTTKSAKISLLKQKIALLISPLRIIRAGHGAKKGHSSNCDLFYASLNLNSGPHDYESCALTS